VILILDFWGRKVGGCSSSGLVADTLVFCMNKATFEGRDEYDSLGLNHVFSLAVETRDENLGSTVTCG
jgi:hypothetical protein